MVQTTLDIPATASAHIEKQTLNYSDEYADYLHRNFSYEGMIENQIHNHILEEEAKTDEIKGIFEELQVYPEFKPQRKPQKYIRVGKK